MACRIYCRIVGYVVTIVLHVGNMIMLAQPLPKELAEDYRIIHFRQLMFRYLTGWTFFLQTVHAISGLWCDILTLKNSDKKNFSLPKHLKTFRDYLFCGIVFPSVFTVCILFWTLYSYDKSQVFPDFVEKLLKPINNHIMHTAILPLGLWEVLFQPREKTKWRTYWICFGIAMGYFTAYMAIIYYTYWETGLWLYPILKNLAGTIRVYLFYLSVFVLGHIGFHLHWLLIYLLWGNTEKSKKKIR